MKHKYVLAHFFETPKTGVIYDASLWAMHVTLLPTFTAEKGLQRLKQELKRAAEQISPFKVKIQGKANFGTNFDIPVSLVERCNEIIQAHQKLLKVASISKISYKTPQFIGDNYNPHITENENFGFTTGNSFDVDTISIVDLLPDNKSNHCRVVQTYNLAG